LAGLGFTLKRHDGSSHAHYEKPANKDFPRSVITVDTTLRKFDEFLLKSMIRQSNRTREQFYGATKTNSHKGLRTLLWQKIDA
jgi:hypothetical protein